MATRKIRSKRTVLAAPIKPHWRNFSDAVIRPEGFKRLPCAQSLRPGLKVIHDVIDGSSLAKAIIASWNPALFLQQFIVVEELAA